jgi:uncharacterized protein YceK
MKNLLLLISVVMVGCSSMSQKEMQAEIDRQVSIKMDQHIKSMYGGAWSETERRGVPSGLKTRDPNTMSPYELTSKTCTATPIFDLNGQFIKYDVRCH